MAPPIPNVHFVQMLVLGGQSFMGLDQQGNVWMGTLRPVGDGTFQIFWNSMAMVFGP